jgi:hypothetical protein
LFCLAGDHIFLRSAESDDNFIGRAAELIKNTSAEPLPSPYLVTVNWFYRPCELNIDNALLVYENEIFESNVMETHPLASVSGKCTVVAPTDSRAFVKPGVYVCSRRYIPSEGRIVPVDGIAESDIPRTFKINSDDGDHLSPRVHHSPRPKRKRSKHGVDMDDDMPPKSKWAIDRYNAAQQHIICALRSLGGVSLDKAVPRSVLREEARKKIGDTGLLDHLLKHLVDQIVSTKGERLQRRTLISKPYNIKGNVLIYW